MRRWVWLGWSVPGLGSNELVSDERFLTWSGSAGGWADWNQASEGGEEIVCWCLELVKTEYRSGCWLAGDSTRPRGGVSYS